MRVAVYGKNSEELDGLMAEHGFVRDDENPEIVISHGGDGTYMKAEYEFPGVPKVPIRSSRICNLCVNIPAAEVFKKLKSGEYRIREMLALEFEAGGKKRRGVNDIVLHNANPRHGIRYALWVDGEHIGAEIIGDGIVAATPLGSSGYYRSITDSIFRVGIGLAFNNSTEAFDHMVVGEGSVIRAQVVRGPAMVYADNQEGHIDLEEGDEVFIRRAGLPARIVDFD